MIRFRRLRTRLSVLYAALFAVAMAALALASQAMLVRHAESSVQLELVASGEVYDRIWSFRTQSLATSADVLARDFGFRDALASGDVATVQSAVLNLAHRVQADNAFVVTTDGRLVGNGPAWLRERAANLPFEGGNIRAIGVIAHQNLAYQFVIRPVLAPVEIGWIIFVSELDAREMRSLESLSAIPIRAEIMTRAPKGWRLASALSDERGALAKLAAGDRQGNAQLVRMDLGGADAFAIGKPLQALGGKPEAILTLRYPVAKAMAGYRPLQLSGLAASIIGLLLVVLASFRLARGIAGPITELQKAAKSLELGDRVDLPVHGEDEIGRLTSSFNAMAAGIFEREDRIAHMAFNDALTGLPNRFFLREQLEARLKRSTHTGEVVAILCLDLDGFKNVNDTLGHPVGDKLLVKVSERLSASAPDCFVARLGGDEFAIIVAGEGDAERCMAMARLLIAQAHEPFDIDGQQALIGTSIGIALAPADGNDADALLKNADLALYRAKQDGRGVFRFFEQSLDEEAQSRRQIELDLRVALMRGEFELHFQPIYAADGERIVCFEALVRWNHPKQGLLGPDRFIRIAEESGLMLRLGEWILQEACRQAHSWDEDIRVAVNVSPIQFRNPALNSVILQALSNGGVSPSRLEIEITESIFLDPTGDTIAMLHRLRELGVRISLDDFGTGYSSLSYLRNFPFDKIKIDKSFVDDVSNNSSAAAIVQAIVDMAAALGMETTAEGVESIEQLQTLRGQGCSSIQGYLLGRPLPASDARRLAAEPFRVARRA
jgi:diguanylate cyclase (GGDEF)-like protein